MSRLLIDYKVLNLPLVILFLLVTGDGVGELALLFLLIFSLWTVNLPSMSQAPVDLESSPSQSNALRFSVCFADILDIFPRV